MSHRSANVRNVSYIYKYAKYIFQISNTYISITFFYHMIIEKNLLIMIYIKDRAIRLEL